MPCRTDGYEPIDQWRSDLACAKNQVTVLQAVIDELAPLMKDVKWMGKVSSSSAKILNEAINKEEVKARKDELKRSGLAKLTAEERKLLGLKG